MNFCTRSLRIDLSDHSGVYYYSPRLCSYRSLDPAPKLNTVTSQSRSSTVQHHQTVALKSLCTSREAVKNTDQLESRTEYLKATSLSSFCLLSEASAGVRSSATVVSLGTAHKSPTLHVGVCSCIGSCNDSLACCSSKHLPIRCSTTPTGTHPCTVSAAQPIEDSSDSDDSFATSASSVLTLVDDCVPSTNSIKHQSLACIGRKFSFEYDNEINLSISSVNLPSKRQITDVKINIAPATPVCDASLSSKQIEGNGLVAKKHMFELVSSENESVQYYQYSNNMNQSRVFEHNLATTYGSETSLIKTLSAKTISNQKPCVRQDLSCCNQSTCTLVGLCASASEPLCQSVSPNASASEPLCQSVSPNHSRRPLIIPHQRVKPFYTPELQHKQPLDLNVKPFSTPQHFLNSNKLKNSKSISSVERYSKTLMRAITPKLVKKKKMNEDSSKSLENDSAVRTIRKVHTSPQLLSPEKDTSPYQPFLTPKPQRRTTLVPSPKPFLTPYHKPNPKCDRYVNSTVEKVLPKTLVRKLSNLNKLSDSQSTGDDLHVDGLRPSPTPYYKKLSFLLAEADKTFTTSRSQLQNSNQMNINGNHDSTRANGSLHHSQLPLNNHTSVSRQLSTDSKGRDSNSTPEYRNVCQRSSNNTEYNTISSAVSKYNPQHLPLRSTCSYNSPPLTPVTLSYMPKSFSLVPLSPPRSPIPSPSCANSSRRLSQCSGKLRILFCQ